MTLTLLLQTLAVVLTQLCIGGLIMTGLVSSRELRMSFFSVNSLICAIAAAVALVLTRLTMNAAWWDMRYLGLTVIGATAAYGCFRLERPEAGRLLVITAALVGLLMGLLPLSTKFLRLRDIRTTAPWFFDAAIVTGALLLGAALVTATLARWYQVIRGLPLDLLQRFSKILLGVVIARIVVVAFTIVAMDQFDAKMAAAIVRPVSAAEDKLFIFLLRAFFGLMLPLGLAFVVMRTVQTGTDRAVTHKLYAVLASVLIGAVLGAFLLI